MGSRVGIATADDERLVIEFLRTDCKGVKQLSPQLTVSRNRICWSKVTNTP
jgi:hypothetical protein